MPKLEQSAAKERRQKKSLAAESALVFTGERIVPQADNCEPNFASRMYHEHLARYLFAAQIVSGKHVLDVGCGVGYGSQRLAELGAASVTAFDLSEDAIKHARIHYSHPNVSFHVANAEEFSFDRKFDVVTCFELIEHVPNPTKVLDRISQALTDDGVLIMSTPRALEQKRTHFHEHEFTLDEYVELLRKYFVTTDMYVENNHFMSLVTKGAPSELTRIECLKRQFDPESADVFIAVATSRPVGLPELEPAIAIDSDAYVTMLERDVEILHKAERDLLAKVEAISVENSDVVAFKDREIARLTTEYQALFARSEDLSSQLWHSERERNRLTEAENELKELQMKHAELQQEHESLRDVVDSLRVRAEDAEARRLDAYEFARKASDDAEGLRRELDTLRGQILDAVEGRSADADNGYDQRYRDIVEAMERLFVGTEATRFIAPDPVVIRVRELAQEVHRLHQEIAALQELQRHAQDWHEQILRIRKSTSWRMTRPFRAIGKMFGAGKRR